MPCQKDQTNKHSEFALANSLVTELSRPVAQKNTMGRDVAAASHNALWDCNQNMCLGGSILSKYMLRSAPCSLNS